MSFNKEEYWRQRNAQKWFAESWARWRQEMVKRFGLGYVDANRHQFTQASYKLWLEEVGREMERKAKEDAEIASLSNPPAPPPTETNPETTNEVKV